MSNLFLVKLLAALCLVYDVGLFVAVATSSTSNDDDYTNNVQHNKEERKRPHIVIILADDMGWNDVSFHGSNQIPTPNIDALAYNGVILNRHYVLPLGTQTRSSLMTGKYAFHLGMQHDVIHPSEPRGLPLSEKLLPQYLKEVGYKTHIVGKWHLGSHKQEYTPTFRGFDTHFGCWNGFQDYYSHVATDSVAEIGEGRFAQGFDMRRNMSVAWETAGKYSTDLFTEEAVRLIDAHNPNDPMFLYLSHLAPHSGNGLLQAPEEEIAKFSYIKNPERKIYAAMVSKLDQSVGEVVEALKNRGMLENSIVLFMSDNGAPTDGIEQNYGSNYPLRGVKASPWEGGVRGVAAIWSPLIVECERVSNTLMFISDWLPTLLFAAGVSEENIPVDGFNMWPELSMKLSTYIKYVPLIIDDIEGYEVIFYYNWKFINGTNKSSRFTWLGDSERSPDESRAPYVPERVLESKAGAAITWVRINRRLSKKKERRVNRIDKLTPAKILQLRKEAEIHCNVTEEERIPCNFSVSPCVFDVNRDPCEMRNEASHRGTKNIVIALMQKHLKHYRSSVVPSNNKPRDARANPTHWNNTWSCWDDPPFLALRKTHGIGSDRSTVPSLVLAFLVLIVTGMTIFILSRSSKLCLHKDSHVENTYVLYELDSKNGNAHFNKISTIITIEEALGTLM